MDINFKDISDIVKDIVNSIDNVQRPKDFAGSPLTYTFFCDTLWARKGKYAYDNQNRRYLINDIVYNEKIHATTESGYLFGGGYQPITFEPPVFVNGTKYAVNNEWSRMAQNLRDKTPLIWLHEVTTETVFGRQTPQERESDLLLFFLDETNPTSFETSNHRHEVVLPMQQLVRKFIDAINDNPNFKNVENYQMRTFSRFGTETEEGIFKNILDANLSGVQLRISLTKYKGNCIC